MANSSDSTVSSNEVVSAVKTEDEDFHVDNDTAEEHPFHKKWAQ